MSLVYSLRPLHEQEDQEEVAALLSQALPYDRVGLVAREKLFGDNGRRPGFAVGAFAENGALVGVLGQAGRFVKVLAVVPSLARRGVGRSLLAQARLHLAQAGLSGKLRIGDHPGNYLSPGVDERYEVAPFFQKQGFVEVAHIDNLQVPLQNNPLVTKERAEALREAAANRGYSIRRVEATNSADRTAVLSLASSQFSQVWADELGKAIGDPMDPLGSGVHAAFLGDGSAVAFAAHDGNNRGLGWFGPMGTDQRHRGQGLGEALLIPCLLDVVDRPEGGVIAWVGPYEFYRRACAASRDRRFVVFEEG